MTVSNILDVARKAGVSKSTTARVLSGTGAVSTKAREKVLAAAATLRYRVNTSARSLRQGVNRLLGAVFPNTGGRGMISHAISAQKLEGIARGAERLGYDLQIFFADLGDPEALRRLAMEKSVGAFLFVGQVQPVTLELLDRYRIPWIGVNWCTPGRPGDPHCWTDFTHAGRTLTQHLVESGCRRIIAFDWLSTNYGPFGAGIRQAWADLGMNPTDLILHSARQFDHGAAVDAALEAALDQKQRPHGILAGHEAAAMSAYRLLRARGLSPGQDIAVATFDDLTSAAHMDPPCTAYAQPAYDMGEACVEELDRVLSGNAPRRIARNIRGDLRVRASTVMFGGNEVGRRQ